MTTDIPLFDLTPVAGPGSREEADGLSYMPMPREMHTYELPRLPEDDAVAAAPAALALLEQLQDALDAAVSAAADAGREPSVLALDGLDGGSLNLLHQLLGEGEVALQIDGEVRIRAQETVLAGVWWLQQLNAQGAPITQWLEVADVPASARRYAFAEQAVPAQAEAPAPGVLNAPSVLVELLDVARQHAAQPRQVPHVVNLSLLPFSPQDHACLSQQLGQGAVVILSRGYGNCRISATAVAGIWRVQYFNSTDQLILDTLEVIDMPQVACAALEDLEDSALRLREIREVLA
jgi:hydrogenase-1 operon protein HyaF